jgi:hypothetical protein
MMLVVQLKSGWVMESNAPYAKNAMSIAASLPPKINNVSKDAIAPIKPATKDLATCYNGTSD